ncbi:hypothetical protein SLS62_009984 [Diatrype stigma]|uniref:Uncharacterized protein n=1 Tax=Diatrype stigma TaxID=117547 RepID=A0AAN9UDV0_9PEZI
MCSHAGPPPAVTTASRRRRSTRRSRYRPSRFQEDFERDTSLSPPPEFLEHQQRPSIDQQVATMALGARAGAGAGAGAGAKPAGGTAHHQKVLARRDSRKHKGAYAGLGDGGRPPRLPPLRSGPKMNVRTVSASLRFGTDGCCDYDDDDADGNDDDDDDGDDDVVVDDAVDDAVTTTTTAAAVVHGGSGASSSLPRIMYNESKDNTDGSDGAAHNGADIQRRRVKARVGRRWRGRGWGGDDDDDGGGRGSLRLQEGASAANHNSSSNNSNNRGDGGPDPDSGSGNSSSSPEDGVRSNMKGWLKTMMLLRGTKRGVDDE